MYSNIIHAFYKKDSGQGMTEYGAMLAFIAALIATTLSIGHGPLGSAIKNAFSVMASNLTQLAAYAS